jgi:hypothetical protein
MKNLRTYITEAKNVHMEHLEDLVLNNGIEGAREIFKFMSALGKMLQGDSTAKVSATVKWDGAPAIFAGVDPKDGKFFVAKKGLFNVNPKMYKTDADIDADLTGPLVLKFKTALTEFAKLGIRKGVIQGDLMFSQGDKKRQRIDGVSYVTFHPNTIVYAVPTNTPFGRSISRAKIGVVWHTKYTGTNIANMRAQFGQPIAKRLSKKSSVWMDDATYKDMSGQATMTAAETKEFKGHLSAAGSLLRTIPTAALSLISNDENVLMMVKTYNNSKVRAGETITNTSAHAVGLIKFIDEKFVKQVADRKSEKGKNAVLARKKEIVGPLMAIGPKGLAKIFDFMNLIVKAKTIIIKKMNQAESIGTFLKTSNGFKVTAPEGFVAIDKTTGGAVKLVDRLEFSRANFSADVIKGW